MKNLLYILAILILFSSCASKKTVVRTRTTITRKVDTLVPIAAKNAHFVPSNNGKTQILVDKKTGIIAEIHYKETFDNENDTTPIYTLADFDITVPEDTARVIIDETINKSSLEKKSQGIPWFYKTALWFAIIVFAIFLIKKFLPKWLTLLK